MDTGIQVSKAVVKAEVKYLKDKDKAEKSQIETTREAFSLLGVQLTAKEFEDFFGKDLRKRAKASGRITDVSGFVSRTKAMALWTCLDFDASAPAMGQTVNDYANAARKALEHAQLSDGSYVYPHNAEGEAIKSGPKTGSTKKAAKSAGDASKQEGGLNVPAALAAARILLGETEDATRLALVAERFPKELAKYLADVMQREADNAVTRNAKKPA